MKEIKKHNSTIQTLLDLNSKEFKQKKQKMHCVNPNCTCFNPKNIHDTNWRRNHGTYQTKAFGEVNRYQCLHCGKTFSDQSFSIDYYVKIPVDYLPLIQALVSTSGLGNLTRFSGLRYELIQNRYERLSRMLLALNADLRNLIIPDEDFVLDGFETFSVSQYYPNNINTITGSSSEFIYGIGFAQLRRKGAMTAKQKKRRAQLESEYGKAPPNAIEMSVYSLMSDLCNLLHRNKLEKKVLKSDEHKAYARAFNRISTISQYIEHKQYSSKAARIYTNPVFSADYTDRQFRKDLANHVRETVQFARCPAAMMVRLSIYQMYHNYLMPKRVKQQRMGNWQTRGEFLGLSKQQFFDVLNEVWGKRVFFNKHDLWKEEKSTWLMAWRNSKIAMGRRVPKYICA